MASKVNLKKYVSYEGKWQFFPVLKVDGKPKPGVLLIGGESVKLPGTYYLEYREGGKRIQRPCGSSPREARDAWQRQMAILSGVLEPDDEQLVPGEPHVQITIETAITTFLSQVKATKTPGTHRAYSTDLAWFSERIGHKYVGQVTRDSLIRMFERGREARLNQKSINRKILVGLMALRNAGAEITLKKGDWPPVDEVEVLKYEPEEIASFFQACDPPELLLFQTFLCSGMRMAEVANLTWQDVDFKHNTLRVAPKPGFTPKSHERRIIVVPGALIASLRKHHAKSKSTLVFPTREHPTRPGYGGIGVDSHHLELCKEIAFRAELNCGDCRSVKRPSKALAVTTKVRKRYRSKKEMRERSCATGPFCKQWYLHKWRHTYATNMLQSGVDLKTLQQQLGHKSLAITEKYLKALKDELLAAKIDASSLARMIV